MIYTELAGIIETDFTGGNRILSELEDLYSSCLAGRQMSREDFLTFVLPEIRQFYQGLGQYIHLKSFCGGMYCLVINYQTGESHP